MSVGIWLAICVVLGIGCILTFAGALIGGISMLMESPREWAARVREEDRIAILHEEAARRRDDCEYH